MSSGGTKIEPSRSFPADRRAWLAVGLLVVATVVASQTLGRRRVVEAPLHSEVTEQFRLVVLGYGRVVEEPDGLNLPASLLAEHLEHLRAAGFVPVDVDQVAAAFEQGRRLPPKSLLLTFDGGFLSTWQAADPVLRRAEWPAVMFLETSRQQDRDTTYLYWHRLQRMVDSGVWRLGARGHRGAPEADGGLASGRLLIESHIDRHQVIAATSMRGLTRPISDRDAGGADGQFAIGIENDLFGVNGPDADPHRLQRLPVDPSINGPGLVKRLAAGLTLPPSYDDPSSSPPVWIRGFGKVTRTDETLLLEGERGAEIWLAGSSWTDGWELTAEILPEAGQFWVISESPEPGRRWLWGGDREGLYLQERSQGASPRQISRAPRGKKLEDWHEIRIVKRGGGLHVEWDGIPIDGSPLVLPWPEAGKVALASASVGGDGARLRIAHLRFRRVPFLVEPIGADPGPGEIRKAVQREAYVAALGPRWLRLTGSAPFVEAPLNRDLLAILCRRHAWQLYPSIEVVDPGPAQDPAWQAWIAERASGAGWDGVHLDLRPVRDADRGEATALRGQLFKALGDLGLDLVVTDLPDADQGATR